MKEFDVKLVQWIEGTVTVQAKNYDEAVEKVMEMDDDERGYPFDYSYPQVWTVEDYKTHA
tara:strand:- start:403 stop:582 length:180 start_codon:yes stop_codon:yes gene_type:complete